MCNSFTPIIKLGLTCQIGIELNLTYRVYTFGLGAMAKKSCDNILYYSSTSPGSDGQNVGSWCP